MGMGIGGLYVVSRTRRDGDGDPEKSVDMGNRINAWDGQLDLTSERRGSRRTYIVITTFAQIELEMRISRTQFIGRPTCSCTLLDSRVRR